MIDSYVCFTVTGECRTLEIKTHDDDDATISDAQQKERISFAISLTYVYEYVFAYGSLSHLTLALYVDAFLFTMAKSRIALKDIYTLIFNRKTYTITLLTWLNSYTFSICLDIENIHSRVCYQQFLINHNNNNKKNTQFLFGFGGWIILFLSAIAATMPFNSWNEWMMIAHTHSYQNTIRRACRAKSKTHPTKTIVSFVCVWVMLFSTIINQFSLIIYYSSSLWSRNGISQTHTCNCICKGFSRRFHSISKRCDWFPQFIRTALLLQMCEGRTTRTTNDTTAELLRKGICQCGRRTLGVCVCECATRFALAAKTLLAARTVFGRMILNSICWTKIRRMCEENSQHFFSEAQEREENNGRGENKAFKADSCSWSPFKLYVKLMWQLWQLVNE